LLFLFYVPLLFPFSFVCNVLLSVFFYLHSFFLLYFFSLLCSFCLLSYYLSFVFWSISSNKFKFSYLRHLVFTEVRIKSPLYGA
jgi:hypothetical protein